MKNIFCFCVLIAFSPVLFSQSKKDIKTNKIKSSMETVTAGGNGKEFTYKDTYILYDKNGNLVEETQYNSDGSVKKKRISKFDSSKNKIEELEYEGDVIIKKHQYSYNSNGDKILEMTFDAGNKLFKKEIYLFNAKGLKVEKKTYDGNNVLIDSHKFTYEMQHGAN